MRSKVASKGLPSPATPLRSESLGSISLRSATGLSELNAQLHLVQSLGSILPHLNRLAEKEQLDAIAAALKMLEGLAPKGRGGNDARRTDDFRASCGGGVFAARASAGAAGGIARL